MAREAIEFTLEDDDLQGGGRHYGWWTSLAIAAGVMAFAAAKKALGGLRQLTPR